MIPATWTEKQLGEICNIYTGNSINEQVKQKKYSNLSSGYNYIATKDIDFSSKIDYENGVKIPLKEPGFKIAPKNSTLLCIEGGSAGRKIAFTSQDICFVNKLCAFVSNNNVLNEKFLFYFLQSPSFRRIFSNKVTGLIGGVSTSKLKSISIVYPSLSEQQRIVEKLDTLFADIEKEKQIAQQNLQNAKDLFESELNKLFAENTGWKHKKLSEVAIDFGRGKSKHRPRNDKCLYDGPYPFIQTGDIRNSKHYITSYTQTYNETGLAQSKLWPKGTLCITIAANIAETGILDFDACFPDSVIGCTFDNNKTNVCFVEYLLQSFKSVLQAKGKGIAQDNINLGTFENQFFPFPEKSVQDSIVQRLDTLHEQTQKLEQIYTQQITDSDELKQAILKKAFNGEL